MNKINCILFYVFILPVIFIGTNKPSFAATYYVATDGLDSNSGSENQPWRKIQKAADTLEDGDTAYVAAGVYEERINVNGSGITIIGQGDVVTRGFDVSGNANRISNFIMSEVNYHAALKIGGSNNIVENSDLSHANQDGVWFSGVNNTLRGNYIHDILKTSITGDPHADCFQTWGPVRNVIIERNFCYHNRDSGSNQIVMFENLHSDSIGDVTFQNNLFIMADGGYSPLNIVRKDGQLPIENITIVGNTFYNIEGGDQGINLNNIDGAVVKNNLFFNFGSTSHPYVEVTSCQGVEIGNNAVYRNDNVIPTGNPLPGDVWLQDPRVVDVDDFDFHLLVDSPLINAGVPTSESKNDFDKVSRPQGNQFDIGAFEFIEN